MVQGMINSSSLQDICANKANIPKGPTGGTLGNSPWRPANVVLGIILAVGFCAPLIEVAKRICGRNVKTLIDCGSMGKYISNLLVPALKIEVVFKKDFKMLELANKTAIKAQSYASFQMDSRKFNYRVLAWVFPNLRSKVILETPWLMKENLNINWFKPEMKM